MTDNDDQLDAQDEVLDTIIGRLDSIDHESKRLNAGVFAKNHLDRTRNILITITMFFFLAATFVLALVLIQIRQTDTRETERSNRRAEEALLQRRQFADCQLPPNTPLLEGVKPGEDPYINPGICFKLNQDRANAFLGAAITRIFDGNRLSVDCIYLRGQGVRPDPCIDVNNRIDQLLDNKNPFGSLNPASFIKVF